MCLLSVTVASLSSAGPIINVASPGRQTLHINLSVGLTGPAASWDVSVWRNGYKTEARDEALIKSSSPGVLDLKEKTKGNKVCFHLKKLIFSCGRQLISVFNLIIHLFSRLLIKYFPKDSFLHCSSHFLTCSVSHLVLFLVHKTISSAVLSQNLISFHSCRITQKGM